MSEKVSNHKALVRESFARQAKSYVHAPIARTYESVAPLIDLSMPGPFDEVLDVGCGAGFVALGFAPFVRKVTGVDLCPEMIEAAQRLAAERRVKNAEFRVEDVENLPFARASYDIVTCRFIFHHFENPQKALAEMRRVSNPMARVMIYDMVSAPDDRKADLHNEIERARDPSHVRMLQDKEWRVLFRKTGLVARTKVSVLIRREFESWMDIVAAPPDVRDRVRPMLEHSAKRDAAGLGIRIRGDRLTFTHKAAIWLLIQE